MDDATIVAGDAAEVVAGEAGRPGSSTTRAIARAGLIVTVLFLASRILGYVRTIAMAAAVPDIAQLDPFNAAFRIPDFLFQLVAAGALSSSLIPILAALLAKDEDARAWRVVSTVSTLMLSALAVLAGVVLLFAPQLVPLITPGFNADEMARTTEMTRIMVLSPLFLAAGSVATSVLNARGRFAAAALAPLVYNAAIIFGALVLVPRVGLNGLAYGVVLGAMGHVLVQVPSVARLGARIVPHVDLHDPQARLAFLLLVPRAIGLGATQVVFLVMTSLATTVGEGSVTVFVFAFTLLQIPIGVIGVPLGVVLLPSLAREAALGATGAFTRLVTRGLGLLAYVMLGLTALGIVVSEDVVRFLFGVAHVQEAAIEATASMLAVFLLGLTAHSLIAVLARSFYALQDTRTPVAAALVAVASNIVIANMLVGPLGLQGLGLAIAISAWFETGVLVILLARRMPGMGDGMRHVGLVMLKSLAVAAAGGLVAYGVESVLLGAWGESPGYLLLFVRGVAAVAAGGLVIVAGSLALRIDELGTIVGVVVDIIRRRGRA
jgi:putative peptidoglycan lipid II flippase